MARKDCIHDDGVAVTFTCCNSRFKTDVSRGETHGQLSLVRGAVFSEPLSGEEGEYTLWLEHVVETKQPFGRFYWFMWYDEEGFPTIPLSGVMRREQVIKMISLLAERSVPH